MKRLVITLLICFFTSLLFAQVKEGNVAYEKSQQPAVIIDLPYSSGVTESAISNYLNTLGSKGNDHRGFKVYKNVKVGDTATADLYFKVDRKSQTESTVYLITAPVDENIAARSAQTIYAEDEAKELLNKLMPAAESAQLDVQVKDQQDAVSKA